MKIICLILACLALPFQFWGQDLKLSLYEKGKVPNSQKSTDEEKRAEADIVRISLVQEPGLEVYLPSKRSATGNAVVICPGGGYAYLSYNWEGTDVARYFASQGVAAIVLKYRLPNSKSNVISYLSPLMDAKRALRITRANAVAWNIKPDQIGIMGFSAGGHLASTLGTHWDTGEPAAADTVERISSRPDFMVLLYPVVTMKQPLTHNGSRTNLLGAAAQDTALVQLYSNELQVSTQTPPTFIVHSMDDKTVPIENSLQLVQAMKNNKVPVEMHIYPYGGHGYGLGIGRGAVGEWPAACMRWIRSLHEKPAQ